jgi:hypothetical protein
VICELPPVIAPMTFVAITAAGVRRSFISSTNSSVVRWNGTPSE